MGVILVTLAQCAPTYITCKLQHGLQWIMFIHSLVVRRRQVVAGRFAAAKILRTNIDR